MSSFRSEALAGVFRNPSILAMVGSVGFHGLFVLFSALKPAESLPTPLSIVSIDTGKGTSSLNQLLAPNGLPVPNGLPPINLGDVPELSTLPDISKLGTSSPSSQSFFLGSNPGTVDLGKLSIANPPQKSIPGSQGPVYSLNLPKPSYQAGTGSVPLSYPGYGVNPYQAPPTVNPGSIKVGGGTPFAAVAPLPSPSPFVSPESEDSDLNAARARERYGHYLASQKLAYGTGLSTQAGPRLTASYPPAACPSKAVGSALIAAIFGPDGALQGGTIEVLSSAPNLALNEAAKDAVRAYRPKASGVPQSLTFNVDIPYSPAVCKTEGTPEVPAQPSSSPTASPGATGAPTVSPTPSSTPSSTSSPQSRPSAHRSTPSPAVERSQTPSTATQPATETSQVPATRGRSTPNVTEAQGMEPLPTPSIAVPDTASPKP